MPDVGACVDSRAGYEACGSPYSNLLPQILNPKPLSEDLLILDEKDIILYNEP